MFKLLAILLSWLAQLCFNVLRAGPVPKHLAIIMDGSRRYSVKHNYTVHEGTKIGDDVLRGFYQSCLRIGIREVTVFAFSIYNYKRSLLEVYAVLTLIRAMLEDEHFPMKHGIRYRFIGNLSLLPDSLRRACAKAMLRTQCNTDLIVNLAISYASRDEITNSIKCIVDGVTNQMIQVEDINEQLIGDCLYTTDCAPVDMIVRSSGETRLSDFLTWQSSSAQLVFVKPLWPEWTDMDLCSIIFHYQRNYKGMQSLRNEMNLLAPQHAVTNQRVVRLLDHLNEFKQQQYELWATS